MSVEKDSIFSSIMYDKKSHMVYVLRIGFFFNSKEDNKGYWVTNHGTYFKLSQDDEL
jgi:hypothetical protein